MTKDKRILSLERRKRKRLLGSSQPASGGIILVPPLGSHFYANLNIVNIDIWRHFLPFGPLHSTPLERITRLGGLRRSALTFVVSVYSTNIITGAPLSLSP